MKRIITVILALVLLVSLATPVFATRQGFVPSITYKEEPEIVPVDPSDDTNPVIGPVYDAQTKEEISHVYRDCLVVTPVSKVDTSTEIPPEAAQVLKRVYEELTDGSMEIPYEKFQGYQGEEMVVRELFDASWLCGRPDSDHDHPTEIEPEGIVFDITFNLGIEPGAAVNVMVYEDGGWTPAVAVVNNGDGTVTCTFEELGVIAVSVAVAEQPPVDDPEPPKTGDTADVRLWVMVMLAALAAFVVVALLYRRAMSGHKSK